MRPIRPCIAVFCVAASAMAVAQSPPADPAAGVVAAAREALGGEKKLSATSVQAMRRIDVGLNFNF